jgi:hypothetical protein
MLDRFQLVQVRCPPRDLPTLRSGTLAPISLYAEDAPCLARRMERPFSGAESWLILTYIAQ